jgi:hypothetical protein
MPIHKLTTRLWIWCIFNILAGIWEIYCFNNRDKLYLEQTTLWEKIYSGQITLSNFWMNAWREYCKVDSRYIPTPSTQSTQTTLSIPYVWYFELINAAISFIFILLLLCKFYRGLKFILAISIINCLLYFATLLYEYLNNKKIKQNMQIYSRWWMFPIYYLICSIWLFVPIYLYLCM